DPLNPGLLSNIERDHRISGIEVKNGFLYVGEHSSPLYIYDYNHPRSPRRAGAIGREWWVYNLKISGDLLFVNDRDHGQLIFDISNPPDCEQIGFIPCTWISEIEVIGDFVYVIQSSRCRVFNIEDPENPQLVYIEEEWNGGSEVCRFDQKLYVGGSKGIFEYDVSDPAHPILEDSLYSPDLKDITVSENLLFGSAGRDGLLIFDLTGTWDVKQSDKELPTEFELYHAYPNPFNSTTTIRYGLGKPAPTRLALYDLSGREVRTLFEGYRQAGFHSVNMNASDLSSGLYFVRLEGSGFTATRKVILIR
ncbi:MAG: T9SS type A sorting domain-containing protein, partial [Calditrichaeota bacterium]|nr:T9SS type A sorting domain-containing protein [Calditrichota bacterium]